jgi:hypothetical protein
MIRQYRLLIICGTMMILTLFAACGPSTTVGMTGLSIVVTGSSVTNDLAGAVRTGPVTLHTNARSYMIKATIFVTVSNQSNHTIYFPDHLTNCTVVLLQQQLSGSWLTANPCRLAIVTRLHSLALGRRLVVRLFAPFNGWPPGLYRATLSYRTSLNAGPLTTIHSAVFKVVTIIRPVP